MDANLHTDSDTSTNRDVYPYRATDSDTSTNRDVYPYRAPDSDILTAHGYGNPDAYSITVTHTDSGTDAADTARHRTYILRRYIGQ